jgi:hypothetical protein
LLSFSPLSFPDVSHKWSNGQANTKRSALPEAFKTTLIMQEVFFPSWQTNVNCLGMAVVVLRLAARCATRTFEVLSQQFFGLFTPFTSTHSDKKSFDFHPNIEIQRRWESQHILSSPLEPPNDWMPLGMLNPNSFGVP